MCWMYDHPEASAQDYLDVLRTKMRKNGWAVQYVESERIPFAYTIGLHDWGLAELLVTGVSPPRASRLLNSVARDALRGLSLTPGSRSRWRPDRSSRSSTSTTRTPIWAGPSNPAAPTFVLGSCC